jgi:DNA (cytosine-5)-methyltransferase 1
MSWLISQALMNSLCLQEQAGGILGGQLLGWRTVCAVELEPYPASVLCARQNDGLLPPFPIWDDMYKPLTENRGEALLMSYLGAFHAKTSAQPEKAQELTESAAVCGSTWHASFAKYDHDTSFVENSPMLTSRGLGVVLGDLASMGFDARWGVLGAADIGANHQRDRIWIVAKWRGQLPHAQHEKIRRWEQQQEGVKKIACSQHQ